MGDRVRMADIAGRLGISTVSVSKALSGDKGVSEETRRRVLAAAEEMGYRGPLRRRMDTRPFALGVLIPSRYLDEGDSFYWRLYQEVAQQGAENHCLVSLEMLEDERAARAELPRLVTEQRVSGLILLGKPPFGYAERLRPHWGRPVVYLDFASPEADMDAVVSNNFYGMAAMTSYLIERGHRDIGFYGSPPATDSIADRYFGFLRALMMHHLTCRPDWRIDDRDTETGRYTEVRLPEELPTAFVCNCDANAWRLVEALQRRGLRVPQDISVVGFDDYQPNPEKTIPLTTWAVDMGEMARLAVGLLLQKQSGEKTPPAMQMSCGRLVERDSVKTLQGG